MKIHRLTFVLIILLLLAACSRPPEPTLEPAASLVPAEVQENIVPVIETAVPTRTMVSAEIATAQVETAAPDCLGDEVSPVGKSIADDYDFSSYEQVMTWFCNGAEFEDILVALETQSQTGTPADEMLQMLAGGFTWDNIWQIIGLTD